MIPPRPFSFAKSRKGPDPDPMKPIRSRHPFILILMLVLILIPALAVLTGCGGPLIRVFPDGDAPLREFTLEGEGKDKILVIPVEGRLTDAPDRGWIRTRPGAVQRITAQLEKAKKDDDVRAVLLKIDSPGGTVTASDLLYHEIMTYKEETGNKVTAVFMNLAASGGYYIALAADRIMAHPTSVTGSVGVIFMRPGVSGFMEKVGLDMRLNKSGKNKDMLSPFREATPEENRMLQDLVNRLAQRFFDLVKKHRNPTAAQFDGIASARIFLAPDALALGLIDEIGYLSDAVDRTRAMAGLADDARVIVYRRNEYADDTLYNSRTDGPPPHPLTGLVPGPLRLSSTPGFYYLWPAAIGNE
jgi:protease IV